MYMGKISEEDYIDTLNRAITIKELSLGLKIDYTERKELREKLDQFIENELGQMLIYVK
ncbi:hypothetical protein [Clostridium perfringens]|uniref:hypothetical protein n=2 Tax=Clostridium perfringens TaxID=1502 RepID=UPI0035181875